MRRGILKKIFIMGCIIFSLLLSSCGKKDILFEKRNSSESEILFFEENNVLSYQIYGKENEITNSESGYSSPFFYTVLNDGTFYCYKFLQNTATENINAIKYVGTYTNDDFIQIKNLCNQNKENELYLYTESLISESKDIITVPIVPLEMDNIESRNSDETYQTIP